MHKKYKKLDSSWFKGSWLIWISESNFLAFRTLNIPIIPWHYDWIICAFSEPCSSWKKNPNYECKLAGNLNHPLDNMFFLSKLDSFPPQCVSGICFNKTNLSKAPKFEMKRISQLTLNHSTNSLTLLQDFSSRNPRHQKPHWSMRSTCRGANRKGFGASSNHHFCQGQTVEFLWGVTRKRSFRKLINLDKIWMNLISNLYLHLGSFG